MGVLQLAAASLLTASLVLGWQWPEFRGPNGSGKAAATGLPLTWSETENVRWKTPLHGRAWSSPVVLGNQVWVTTATADGRQLSAIAVDQAKGTVIHDIKLFDVATPQYAHPFNTYASPTPVIEPGRVYVTFGSPGTAAIDTATGKVLWERRDFECNHYRGAGSSPVIFRDLLLLHYDGSDLQYVVALDKRTGKTVWKTQRSIDFKDLGSRRQAAGRRRHAQGVCDAADRHGGRRAAAHQHGRQGDLCLRPADRQGAVACRGADEPLGQHASGLRLRPRVPADRLSQGRAAGGAPRGPRRHHRDACRLAADARRAQQAVGAAGRRPALHDDRCRCRQRRRGPDRRGGVDGSHWRQALGLARGGRRPHLLLQRGRHHDRDRGCTYLQGPRRESSWGMASWHLQPLPARRSSCGPTPICIASNRDDSTRPSPAKLAPGPPVAALFVAASAGAQPAPRACRSSTGRT